MRHLAFLGAVPQPKKRTLADSDAPPVSRIEALTADGVVPAMPPCSAPHLVAWLMEVGPIEPGVMDQAPIGWSTLRDWQAQIGLTLPPWQVRLLRRLSRDYAIESRRARDEDCPAPWGVITEDQREAVDAKLRAAFGGLARAKRH